MTRPLRILIPGGFYHVTCRGYQREKIGAEFGGLDYTTFSRERKRIQERADLDKQLGKAMTEINESLRLK